MDYSNIKLGLIEKFKVFNMRRQAEKVKAWRDNIENEVSEVDYSKAEELETYLLKQKRIKIATKHATKLYRKDNTGISKEVFIENYLIENGLKPRILAESSNYKNHSFMKNYPTEKSQEELNYEQENQIKTMYYEIDGKKYEIPLYFSSAYFQKFKNGTLDLSIPLTTNDGINYLLNIQELSPKNKYIVLNQIIHSSINQINTETYMISNVNPDTKLNESFSKLTRQTSLYDYHVKKLYSEGKIEEAIKILETMTESVLKFYQAMSRDDEKEL